MELLSIEWQEQGYRLLLVEAKVGRFHLFVSADGERYTLYDHVHAPSLDAAQALIKFAPFLYEAIPPAFPISRERALSGETGIPSHMEPVVDLLEEGT